METFQELVSRWEAMNTGVKDLTRAADDIQSTLEAIANSIQTLATALGTLLQSDGQEAEPDALSMIAGSLFGGVLPAFQRAFRSSVVSPLRIVHRVFEELSSRIAQHASAQHRFEAASKKMASLQRRSNPKTAGLLGVFRRGRSTEVGKEQPSQPAGTGPTGGDAAQVRIVEELLHSQKEMETLEELLREQLQAWCDHRPALAEGVQTRATACVRAFLSASGASADHWSSGEGSPTHSGVAADRLVSALDVIESVLAASTSNKITSRADLAAAQWWLPPTLRTFRRGLHAPRVRMIGRAVHEPPMIPSGVSLFPSKWYLEKSGAESSVIGLESLLLPVPSDLSLTERDDDVVHARRIRTNDRWFLVRRVPVVAALSWTQGRRLLTSRSRMGLMVSDAERVDGATASTGSSHSALDTLRLSLEQDHLSVVVMDEDTATDSEVGKTIASSMSKGDTEAILPRSAGSSGESGAKPHTSFSASRVLFRRRWLRQICQGLSVRDLLNMQRVCKRWANVIRTDRTLWMNCIWNGAVSASPELRPQFWAWVTGASGQAPTWSRGRGVTFLLSDATMPDETDRRTSHLSKSTEDPALTTTTTTTTATATTASEAELSPDQDESSHVGSVSVPQASLHGIREIMVCSEEEYNALLKAAAADLREKLILHFEEDVPAEAGDRQNAHEAGLKKSVAWALDLEQDLLRSTGCIPGRSFGDLPSRRRDLPRLGRPDHSVGGSSEAMPLEGSDRPASPWSATSGDEVSEVHDDLELGDEDPALELPDEEPEFVQEPSGGLSGECAGYQSARLRGLLLLAGQTLSAQYVQGMNHLGAILLQYCAGPPPAGCEWNTEPERSWEDFPKADRGTTLAFTLLQQVMGGRGFESLLSRDMRHLGALMFQIDRLLVKHCPRLHEMLTQNGVFPSSFAGGWVLSLFGSYRVVPPETVVIIWDAFLAGGWSEVCRGVLGVLQTLEPILLRVAAAATEEGSVMEQILPVLQAPRSFFPEAGAPPVASSSRRLDDGHDDDDDEGSVERLYGIDKDVPADEAVFGKRVVAHALRVRVKDAELRSLASQFATVGLSGGHGSALHRGYGSSRMERVGMAVRSRVARMRERFRRPQK
jgi:hypothetical protein